MLSGVIIGLAGAWMLANVLRTFVQLVNPRSGTTGSGQRARAHSRDHRCDAIGAACDATDPRTTITS